MGDHPLLDYADEIRAAMLRRDAKLLNSLVKEYLAAYARLRASLTDKIADLSRMRPTLAQLQEIAILREIMGGIKLEMDKFANIMGDMLSESMRAEIEFAMSDTLGMVQAALPGMKPAQIAAMWTRLIPEQVYVQYSFLDPGGPLFARMFSLFGEAVANRVREELIRGYIMGMNPREIARLIRNGAGVGMNWALSTARTANLWAYRAASQMNYANNSGIVQGWYWHAELVDGRACMSCISQHGSFHTVNEILADHHRGRCTQIPATVSYADLGIYGVEEEKIKIVNGEDWFRKQPKARQIAMMGRKKWQAWQDGKFNFSQLSRPYTDPVYGKMYGEASLQELLSGQANSNDW